MGKQGIRLDARRTVREALDGIRKERLERDRRVSRLAVALVTAVAKRDEAAAEAEKDAAETLRALLAEDLTLTDVGDLCGGTLTIKELTRLSRLPQESRVAASREA
ncbi:MAG: hypothetical protein IT193_07955 [Propionibacteriaceae bacterium]|nr:hypothetical protein [Propionibacteriaceae bacterium]